MYVLYPLALNNGPFVYPCGQVQPILCAPSRIVFQTNYGCFSLISSLHVKSYSLRVGEIDKNYYTQNSISLSQYYL